jgi:hypothetical protein
VEARAHRRSGPLIPVHESEIGQAGEHEWVTGCSRSTGSGMGGGVGGCRWRAKAAEKIR